MTSGEVRNYWDDRGLLLLWLTVLSGPAAWALNQVIGYALVKPACSADAPFVVTAIAAAAFGVTVWGAWTAWSLFHRLRHANPEGGRKEDRSQMLAVGGLALNALLGLLIALSASMPFFLSPCE